MHGDGPTREPATGFTLELDGEPEAIGRIISAVYAEMGRLYHDAWQRDDSVRDVGLITALPRAAVLPVRGQIHLRWPVR